MCTLSEQDWVKKVLAYKLKYRKYKLLLLGTQEDSFSSQHCSMKHGITFNILRRRLWDSLEMTLNPDRPRFEASSTSRSQPPWGGCLNHASPWRPQFPNSPPHWDLPRGCAWTLRGLECRGAQKMVFLLEDEHTSLLKETSKAADNKVQSYSNFHSPVG